MAMEIQSLIKDEVIDPDGLFEQRYNVDDYNQINPVSAILKFLTLSGKLETEQIKPTESEFSFPPEVLLSSL